MIESGATIKLVDRDQATRVAERLVSKLQLGSNEVREMQKMPVEKIMAAYFAVVKDMGGADQMTEGFSPPSTAQRIPQHPFYPVASDVSAERAAHARSHPDRDDARNRRADAFSLDEEGMRDARQRLDRATAASRIDRDLSQAQPGRNAVGYLLPDRQRLPLRRAGHEDRRTPRGAGQGPVYLYYFRWETPVQGGRLKSPHTIEIPFAFDNVKISAQSDGRRTGSDGAGG